MAATRYTNQAAPATPPADKTTVYVDVADKHVKTKIDDGTVDDLQRAATTANAGRVKQAAAVANLGLTVSNPPTQAEVQAIADKLDELLGNMRTAGELAT